MNTRYTLHRLSLLDQWRFDRFRLLFCIAVVLIFSAVIYWVLPLFGHGNIQNGFVGMLCGLSVNFWLTCIGRLRIDSVDYVDKLAVILERYKYKKNGLGYYDIPAHRYMKFKSQRIYLNRKNETLVITGPYNILKKVIKQLNAGAPSEDATK